MYPSVKGLPISEERAELIKSEIISTLYNRSESRKLLNRIYVDDKLECKAEQGFVTVGLKSILDRIWFVDNPSDKEYYSCKGIGVDLAEDIAETETKYVSTAIEEKVKTISFDSPIKPSYLQQAANLLAGNEAEADILMLNVKDHVQLWHYNALAKKGRICVPSELTGLRNDVEIQFFRLLPEGTSIMVDSTKLGSLLVRKKIEETTMIQDIPEADYEKVLKELQKLNRSQLPEKVRILSYEVIKAKIENPEAGVIIKVKGPER